MVLDIEDDLIDFGIQLGRTLRRGFQPAESELGLGDSGVLPVAVVDEAAVAAVPVAAVQLKVVQPPQLTLLNE